ncbi:hypothetical protein IAQ61_001828 [Plenodomus lingam]|uniref:uncharacterized protein n=1 Tax=Leptosphaeria maculans TaxID=5022 RepID=UPI00332961EC|nr:hypothetical protein IAQ61_001828 [Plenodomus lingam]
MRQSSGSLRRRIVAVGKPGRDACGQGSKHASAPPQRKHLTYILLLAGMMVDDGFTGHCLDGSEREEAGYEAGQDREWHAKETQNGCRCMVKTRFIHLASVPYGTHGSCEAMRAFSRLSARMRCAIAQPHIPTSAASQTTHHLPTPCCRCCCGCGGGGGGNGGESRRLPVTWVSASLHSTDRERLGQARSPPKISAL